MEYLTELIANSQNDIFIWDDKYNNINSGNINYQSNVSKIMGFLTNLMIVYKNNNINIEPNFYYLARKLASYIRTYVPTYYSFISGNNKPMIEFAILVIDVFSTFEDIQKTYHEGKEININGTKYKIQSIYEYFVYTRSIVPVNVESCIPYRHLIPVSDDPNLTSIYNKVWDIIGPNERRLNNKRARD